MYILGATATNPEEFFFLLIVNLFEVSFDYDDDDDDFNLVFSLHSYLTHSSEYDANFPWLSFSHEYESEFKNEHSKSGRALKSDVIKKKQPYFQINVEQKIHISIDKDVHCTLAQKTRFEFHYSHFK